MCGEFMFEILSEHFRYKKQIIRLAKSDIKRSYSGSILGGLWAVIKPCIQIFIYWFTFAIGLRVSKTVSGYPYFLWLITSIIPWFYMNDMLSSGIKCFKKYSYLVTTIKFPTCNIPTFVSLSKFFINFILIILNILIFIGFGYKLDIYFLQLPIFLLFMFTFFTSLNLILSTLSVFFKDVPNLVKSLTNALFWLSGILWDPTKIDIGWLKVLLNLNPITFLINFYRDIFINKCFIFNKPLYLIYFLFILILTFAIYVFCYKKYKKVLPDFL